MDDVVVCLPLLLLVSAALAVNVLFGGWALARRSASLARAWRRPYSIAWLVGAGLGALAGVIVTFLLMAISGGLAPPWNVLIFPVGSLIGGLAFGLLFMLPVVLAQGLSWLLARVKAHAAPDE